VENLSGFHGPLEIAKKIFKDESIKQLNSLYDYIIVDTRSLSSAADALPFISSSDLTLLITTSKGIELSDNQIIPAEIINTQNVLLVTNLFSGKNPQQNISGKGQKTVTEKRPTSRVDKNNHHNEKTENVKKTNSTPSFLKRVALWLF
jgi:MinD-like ATPase involved in chromosome partitioning or flagellar assembly